MSGHISSITPGLGFGLMARSARHPPPRLATYGAALSLASSLRPAHPSIYLNQWNATTLQTERGSMSFDPLCQVWQCRTMSAIFCRPIITKQNMMYQFTKSKASPSWPMMPRFGTPLSCTLAGKLLCLEFCTKILMEASPDNLGNWCAY